nr:immunoglobulin heavy chain junction region [Macaca mulatta]MOV54506.1 immunoglobulin heavy chain junction region [Macaca mulatta]
CARDNDNYAYYYDFDSW